MPKKPINREMPDGFEAPVRRTERSANASFVEWANEIIRGEGLGLGDAVQETSGRM